MEWMENGMYYKPSINIVEIYKAGIRKREGEGQS